MAHTYTDLSSRLRSELDSDSLSIQAIRKATEKVDALSAELKNKRRELGQIQAEKAQLLEYRDQFFKATDERDQAVSECEKLRSELQQTGELLADLKLKREAEMAKYKSSFDDMDALLVKERETHKSAEDALIKQLRQQEEKIRSLDGEMGVLQREKQGLQDQLESIRAARGQVEEAETRWKERIEEAEKRAQDGRDEALRAQSKCQELAQNNDKLRAEVAKLNQYQSLFNIERSKVPPPLVSQIVEHQAAEKAGRNRGPPGEIC